MPGLKRVLTILIIVLGPVCILYFLAKNLRNKFIELPYIGQYDYTYDDNGNPIDSIPYSIPEFQLTKFDGTPITKDSTDGKIIVLTTIQPNCPDLDECGMSFYIFNELFYSVLIKNQANYGDVKILSILTDVDGNPVHEGPSEKLLEEMEEYDPNVWWMAYGDPNPLFSWDYYGKDFMEYEAEKKNGEIGKYAFPNSLVIMDQKGCIRGVSGAKKDSDIRNFFDMVKLLKKADFDRDWEERHKND
ncbi:MAG: hypothetical protein ABJG68_04250 [Crocinitomicaceae bacterium]